MIIVLMGVTGCGKTTIGKLLSQKLDIPFFDADHYHTDTNIDKMSRGIPLTDEDREPWLLRLSLLLQEEENKKGAILACSALKESYRKLIQSNVGGLIRWFHLDGTYELILERLKSRTGHFMPHTLLRSQFETLEKSPEACTILVDKEPEIITEEIIKTLN